MSVENAAKPEINITPLIDILLVLLIIFMIVTPLSPARFETRLPAESDGKADLPNFYPLVVTIEKDSTLTLNDIKNLGTIAEPQKLLQQLNETFQARLQNRAFSSERMFDARLSDAQKVEKTVFVKAPRGLPYDDVTKLIDVLQLDDAPPIALQLDDLD